LRCSHIFLLFSEGKWGGERDGEREGERREERGEKRGEKRKQTGFSIREVINIISLNKKINKFAFFFFLSYCNNVLLIEECAYERIKNGRKKKKEKRKKKKEKRKRKKKKEIEIEI
jgi:hypothetical protein